MSNCPGTNLPPKNKQGREGNCVICGQRRPLTANGTVPGHVSLKK